MTKNLMHTTSHKRMEFSQILVKDVLGFPVLLGSKVKGHAVMPTCERLWNGISNWHSTLKEI